MREMTFWRTIGRIVVVTLIAGVVVPYRARAQASVSGPFAYVTNQNSGTVTVIDTSTNTVVTSVSLCVECTPGPKGVAVTPNGKFVYVANNGNGTVTVIATSTNTVLTTITLPFLDVCECSAQPFGVAITPDGTRAYVTDAAQGAVHVINTATNVVTTSITSDVGNNPETIAISSDGLAAFYTFDTNSLGRIDTNPSSANFNRHTTTLTVGTNPTSGVALTPNSAFIYVTNKGDNTVSVIQNNFPTFTFVTTIALGEGTGPNSIAITPNGQFAYVVDQGGSGNVSVISTATNTVGTPVSGLCATLNQIAIAFDGSKAYVADAECDKADVISTSTNTVTATVSVGSGPFGVAIGPTATTGLLPVSPGATLTFTDDNIINQIVTIPGDANVDNVAFMQMLFIQVPPAVFNSTRLTGVEGNPWSGGNQGPFTSPPTMCTVITGTGGNCMVMEGKCFDPSMIPLPTCNITARSTLITLTSHYKTPTQQTTPGFLIADDDQNNWANIIIGFDPADPTIHGGTSGCQMDTVIVNLGGPVAPTPVSVNFGNVPVGGLPIRIVTVKNKGTSPLSITSAKVASLLGQDSDDFFALDLCLFPLRPGQSCPIFVGFFADADDFNLQAATLHITNNAPGSPQLIVPLTATVVK